jgi:hypothetical protein
MPAEGSQGTASTRASQELWEGIRRFSELPDWLAAASRADVVADTLAQHVPELSAGELIATVVKPRLRLRRAGWSARYGVTVEGPGAKSGAVRLVGILSPPGAGTESNSQSVGAFGSNGWSCTLPGLGLELETEAADAAIEVLPLLTDPERSRALLEQSIRACTPSLQDIRIASASPRIVRLKPGNRVTILYELAYSSADQQRGWPDVVVAKTYRGDKAKASYQGMQALWGSELRAGRAVTVAQPLAYIPELRVVVQGPIREEQTLKDLLRSALRTGSAEGLERLSMAMERAAAGLAALHRCGVVYGRTVTISDEMAEIREMLDELDVPISGMAEAAAPLLARVEEMASRTPADALAPAHGAFRPAQVLLHGDDIGFIDFDGFCRAEPARDLALFTSAVRDIGMEEGQQQGDGASKPVAALDRWNELDEICDAFVRKYESLAPISRTRLVLWETLGLFTYVLNCWSKVQPERLRFRIVNVERHLRASGLATQTARSEEL